MLPAWTQSLHFDPPTWLTPLFLAPWVAMGWAFVLNEMFEEDARRGVVKTRGPRAWTGSGLSSAARC